MTPIVPLRQILRAQGRRRPLTLRPIQTTQAQAKALQRIYAPIMQVWSVGVRERILPAYARSLATFTGDSPADIEVEIEVVDEEAVRATLDFRALFREWASDAVKWHLDKIGSQLTYATNVELTTQLGGAQGTVDDLLARNVALVRDVSDQARGRIADIVFRGLQQRTPIRDVAKEINDALGLGRARSLRIASDQTVKMSAALDKLRQEQLGFSSFVWRHSGKVHYRPEHLARDGQVFSWQSEVAKTDPPGYAPFCGCKALAHMDMDDELAPTREETATQRTARLNEEARDYVITNGKRDNFEYLYAFDKSTGEVIDKYTSNAERFVSFTPAVVRAISDPKRKIVVRHNHPSSTSLSGQDTLMMGEFPGMAEMVADGIDGSYYHAARGRRKITQKAVDGVQREVRRILQRQVNDRTVTPEDAGKLEAHLRNVRLNTLGYLKYTFRFEGDTLARVNRNKAALEEAERWLK